MMPILAGWISSLFISFSGLLAAYFTKKVALIVAAVATFAGLTTALFVGMAGLVASLVMAFPLGGLTATGVWLFLPDNALPCISAMISADTMLSLYFWQKKNLEYALYV